MTIDECERRTNSYKQIAEEIRDLSGNWMLFPQDKRDLILLAVLRSIAIEDLNIADLKKGTVTV